MEKHQSEYNYDASDSMEARSIEVKTPTTPQPPTHEAKTKVKEEMNREIKDLQEFRDKSNKFYDNKIN